MPGNQGVGAGPIIGFVALVKERQVVEVDGIGLVIAVDNRPAAADILGPGPDSGVKGDVFSPQKGGIEVCGIPERRPGAAEVGGGQGAEKAVPVAADALNVGQEHAGSFDGIDIVGLKEVVGVGFRVDDDGGVEAVGEVTDGGRTAVEISVVAGEKQVGIGGIADDPEIDPIAHARGLGREEILRDGPILGLGGVAVGGVLGLAALEDQVPLVLRGEIEHLRRGVIAREAAGFIHEIGCG